MDPLPDDTPAARPGVSPCCDRPARLARHSGADALDEREAEGVDHLQVRVAPATREGYEVVLEGIVRR